MSLVMILDRFHSTIQSGQAAPVFTGIVTSAKVLDFQTEHKLVMIQQRSNFLDYGDTLSPHCGC